MTDRVDPTAVADLLSQRRLVVVGASRDPRKFGNTIYRSLRDHGYDVTAVNPAVSEIDGEVCYPHLAAVPGDIDAVIVMVNESKAADIVRACIDRGVQRVWLFKGLGAPGAVSDEALRLCEEHDIVVVPGACPLMFLEPVGWFHRIHRAARHAKGSLAKVS